MGSERVATAERIADQMIAMGHSDNATIAQWKEGLNETWQDLLELIETRTQVCTYTRYTHNNIIYMSYQIFVNVLIVF